MDLFGQVVTDADEIYTYFEVIRLLSPASILDAGMMLKRMGAVSRQAMHCGIPQTTRLDGIDFYPEVELPIYQTIYDHIYPVGQLPGEYYRLAVCLGFNESSPGQQSFFSGTNLDYLAGHASAILLNANAKEAVDFFKAYCACQPLSSGNRAYILAYLKGV